MTERLYVLDTHVPIWYFIGSPRLHTVLRDLIDQTRNEGGHLLVPTITLSEALTIAEKRRVDLDFPELYRLVREEPEFEIVGFGPEIFEETLRVPDVPEIHDRIIVATARFYRAGVMTRDRIIRASGVVERLQ